MATNHRIDWRLVLNTPDVQPIDGAPGPIAQLTCLAPEDAPCRDVSYEDVIDTSGYPLASGECYATVMIELAGAAQMWAGSQTYVISGREIDIKPVGDDFVWKYADEEWASPPESDSGVAS